VFTVKTLPKTHGYIAWHNVLFFAVTAGGTLRYRWVLNG